MAHVKQSEINHETSQALPEFEQLLSLAIETTINDSSVFERNLEIIQNRERPHDPLAWLFKDIGSLAAKEIIDGINGESEIKDPDDGDDLLLPYDEAIKNKIEALGQSILDEAFECLGSDAPDMVKRLQEAQTDQEFINVMDWLIARLKLIREASNEKIEEIDPQNAESALDEEMEEQAVEQEPDLFYHPARLSPKLIGKFPNINAEPTCLGYSILAASFFEKAEMPYMHAGVVSTAAQMARVAQLNAGLFLQKLAEEDGNFLSDDRNDHIDEVISLNASRIYGHTGFHAAVYARFRPDRWFQLDPNYDLNVLLTPPASDLLEEAYADLSEISRVDPAMEQNILNTHAINPYGYLIGMQDLVEQMPSVEEVDDFLKEVPPDLALSEIIENYFKDFVDFDVNSKNDNLLSLKIAFHEYCKSRDLSTIHSMGGRLHTALISNVFLDAIGHDDISGCVERCKYDDAYRQRRAEDLRMAPILAAFQMLLVHGNALIKNDIKYPHAVVQVGSPAYRIGASVLSDFAVYCGDELPLSFWMTYWPSSVSFAEHYENTDTAIQEELRTQIARRLKKDGLNYPLIDVIIKEVHE